MGASVPNHVKYQLQQVDQVINEEVILDSENFTESKYLSKAMEIIAKKKSIQSVVLKMDLQKLKLSQFLSSFTKLCKDKKSITLYGQNLNFLGEKAIHKLLKQSSFKIMQIKSVLIDSTLEKFVAYTNDSPNLESLTFKQLEGHKLDILLSSLSDKSNIRQLNLVYDTYYVEEQSFFDEDLISACLSTQQSFMFGTNNPVLQSNILTLSLQGWIQPILAQVLSSLFMHKSVRLIQIINAAFNWDAISYFQNLFQLNKSIKGIEVNQGLPDEAAVTLFRSLTCSNCIVQLSLYRCIFSMSGFYILRNLFKSTYSIQVFQAVELINIKREGIKQEENLILLLEGLKDNKSIIDFVLINSFQQLKYNTGRLNDQLCQQLYECIANNQTLSSLKLQNFLLSGQEIWAIGQSISQNSSIISLDISGNLMGWQDFQLLSQGIRYSKALQKLNVKENKLQQDFKSQSEDIFQVFSWIQITLENLLESTMHTVHLGENLHHYKDLPPSLQQVIQEYKYKFKTFI